MNTAAGTMNPGNPGRQGTQGTSAVMDADGIEAALSFARLVELNRQPVQGDFDLAHLLELHRRIFQDIPGNRPGEVRPPAPAHIKFRSLLATPVRYRVYYAHSEGGPEHGGMGPIEQRVSAVLAEWGGRDGIGSLRGTSDEEFAARLTQLYTDLDYLHLFTEGNSRTLRAFTSQVARQAGRALRWVPERFQTPEELTAWGDRLCLARDRACAEKALRESPGPNQEHSIVTICRLAGGLTMADIMREVLLPPGAGQQQRQDQEGSVGPAGLEQDSGMREALRERQAC